MSAQVIGRDGDRITIQIECCLSDSMLDTEEAIQTALNEAGTLATKEALGRFDTDGSPIEIGNVRLTSKGRQPKHYQTPYGQMTVERHVYQTAGGGKTYCPLEQDARIIIASTPRFAKQVSHKYAQTSGAAVVRDLKDNHARAVTTKFVQDLCEAVGSIAQAHEEDWEYELPQLDRWVKTIAIGVDGTSLLLTKGGYRQAMVGTLSLYDGEGERLHTIYIGASPEYGKSQFFARMQQEIERIKTQYPEAFRVGVADGAADNWTFLEEHTQAQVLDFYHAAEYLAEAAVAIFPRDLAEREQWLADRCHRLKHKRGAATRQLNELRSLAEDCQSESLAKAITYFENHRHQMQYASQGSKGRPIGSGVTEAACKVLVKQRLGRSGMKWKTAGAGLVLSLRSLVMTPNRWPQFWTRINQSALNLAV